MTPFVVDWRQIVEGGVAAPGLVAALDELEHRHAGLNLSAEAAAVEQLAFEGGEEAHLCASFSGWTWGCVETELTLPQVHALSEYLAEHPPVHLLVAAALGAKPTSAIKESTIEEVEAVASALGIPVTRQEEHLIDAWRLRRPPSSIR